jgi:hypothetical protein
MGIWCCIAVALKRAYHGIQLEEAHIFVWLKLDIW